MADNSKKTKKQTPSTGYDVPTLKNPIKTLWGKIIVVIILAGMVALPFIGLIIMLIEKA
ncbi:MAG: hypothetical protein RBQ91_04080 [Acholeplasma sp.]|nr:hypothetical protein [Acholeplasma sp.]